MESRGVEEYLGPLSMRCERQRKAEWASETHPGRMVTWIEIHGGVGGCKQMTRRCDIYIKRGGVYK